MSRLAFDAARLDDPIWWALTTDHSRFAQGESLARRYPPDITPFAAVEKRSAAADAALHDLVPGDREVVLFAPEPQTPPDGLTMVRLVSMEQMVTTDVADTRLDGVDMRELSERDAPEMQILAALTNPGPFGPRAHVLGRWVGIRVAGTLVAMAGERLRFTDHVEVSGVCVHPDHRRAGYARLLVTAVARRALAEGLVPFLHVRSENSSAIALYRHLNFECRRTMYAMVLSRGAA